MCKCKYKLLIFLISINILDIDFTVIICYKVRIAWGKISLKGSGFGLYFYPLADYIMKIYIV